MNLPAVITIGHKPYRVWTVGLLPLNQLPRFAPGMTAPVFVQHAGWTVIVDRGTIYAYRGGIQHELHGTTHPSAHDAERAAYGAGLLGVMVYDEHAADYGFPSAS
jgi:hypothetical protein